MTTRPVECPACGHEGISRGSSRLEGRDSRGDVPAESWTCRLCAYTWSQSAPARRVIQGPDQMRI